MKVKGDLEIVGAASASNLSNTNTGDNAVNTLYSGLQASIDGKLNLDQTTPQAIINGAPVFDAFKFNLTATPLTSVEGLLQWNAEAGTVDVGLPGGVTGQLFQETFFDAKNGTGSTVTDGTPVMFAAPVGTSGKIEFQLAIADDSLAPEWIMGVVTETILAGEYGKITWFGKVRGIDTTGTPYGETWTNGDIIYVSPTTAGYLTNVEPNAPNRRIVVAAIIAQHATLGVLMLRPSWSPKLTELDDINGTILTATGQLMVWDHANDYFDFTHNINDYQVQLNGTGFVKVSGTTISYDNSTYDNYVSWNLKTNGTQRIAVVKGGTLDIQEGTGIGVSYGAGGVIIIEATGSSTNSVYKEEFTYSSSSTFTTLHNITQIISVSVQGQELNTAQYTPTATNVTIDDTLETGDIIIITYSLNTSTFDASNVAIIDTGGIISASDVEGALQENRTAIDLNTAKDTNATHTGEVTGSGALIIASDVVDTDNLAVRYKAISAISASAVDWTLGQVYTKTLPSNTTLVFSNLYVGVKDFEITGDYALVLPTWVNIIDGVYDGTVDNFIQVVCTNAGSGTEKGWATINKEAT